MSFFSGRLKWIYSQILILSFLIGFTVYRFQLPAITYGGRIKQICRFLRILGFVDFKFTGGLNIGAQLFSADFKILCIGI
jgi:hypothetical protein